MLTPTRAVHDIRAALVVATPQPRRSSALLLSPALVLMQKCRHSMLDPAAWTADESLAPAEEL